jgi:glycosyltransferase
MQFKEKQGDKSRIIYIFDIVSARLKFEGMKISIITVVYNNASTLGECIESVVFQTYPDIEYIVIDGNSTDGSKEVIKRHENKISRWISEPDKGMYDALNKGIGMATGEVIGILHSDDIFNSTSVITEITELFTKTGCDAVYGDLLYVAKDNPSKTIRYWKSMPFQPGLLRKGWMPPHPTFFVRKKCYETLGGFDTSFTVAADYELVLRFFSSGRLKCEYLPKVITKMRVGGKSNKSIRNIIRKSCDDYRSLRKNKVGGLWTLFLKNFSKVGQFLFRDA